MTWNRGDERMQYFGLTDIGLKRETNEDFISVPSELESIKLFILADGMGGANAGELASATAVKTVKTYIRNNFIKIERTKEDLENLVYNSMIEANKRAYNLSLTSRAYKGMGTTLLVAWVYRNRIYIGHIGDSRLYRIRQNIFRQLTKDHTYVQDLVKQGAITPEEAKNHPQKNILLKVLGCEKTISPDVISKGLAKGDVILMCSDGLYNMLDDKYIYETIMKNIFDVNIACKKLIDKANHNGGLDNVSAIIISN